jgi:hypothetical protein
MANILKRVEIKVVAVYLREFLAIAEVPYES